MDARILLREREELIDNAYNFRHNKRIPLLSQFDTWKYIEAGYKFSEVLYNYSLIEKVQLGFQEKYQFDLHMNPGTRNNMRTAKILGGGFHYIHENDEAIIVHDHNTMEPSDYELFVKDPDAFMWSVAFKNFVKPGITLGELVEADREMREFQVFTNRINDNLINGYGAMLPFARGTTVTLETFFRSFRGIRGLSLDLRRFKTQLKEISDREYTSGFEPGVRAAMSASYDGYAAQLGMVMLAHSILNSKQFEELYWPYLKRTIDIVVENRQRLFIFVEGAIGRFAEFFQDIPRGVLMLLIEQDDIFELRKKLPNVALAGGMPTNLLGYGTKEQCVDYAKKLVDTLGSGFVMSQDKIISFRNDCKPENLLAVNEFALSYSC